MNILVDASRCSGHGRCFAEAPQVYQLDELGYNSTDVTFVPPDLYEQARRGADACPELALTVIEKVV